MWYSHIIHEGAKNVSVSTVESHHGMEHHSASEKRRIQPAQCIASGDLEECLGRAVSSEAFANYSNLVCTPKRFLDVCGWRD
jgi:hypothetical protein